MISACLAGENCKYNYQVILIYCRSGNRCKQAAQKLFDIDYTNVYEFGGINDWTGEVVTNADLDTRR